MAVNTMAMGLIVLPGTCVDVTISVNKTTLSVGLVLIPVAFIHGAIGPGLGPFTLSNISIMEPFSLKSSTVFENFSVSFLSLSKLRFVSVVSVDEGS